MTFMLMPAAARADDSHPHDSHSCSDSCHISTDPHRANSFYAWSWDNKLPVTNGSYSLTHDVTLNAACELQEDVTICLNGHTINLNGYGINVNGHTFVVTDCGTNGKITGGGGTDDGFHTTHGGAVYLPANSTFELYQGTLCNNEATFSGGAVALHDKTSTFNMYGGSISNNKTQLGGGVYSLGTFCMYGGSISNNQATENGGGVNTEYDANFTMSGGSITNNSSAKHGGGLYALDSISLSGNAHIYGNSLTSTSYYGKDAYLLFGEDQNLTLVNALTYDTANPTYVYVPNEYTFTSGWSTYMTDKEPSDYFVSDNPGHPSVILTNGELALGGTATPTKRPTPAAVFTAASHNTGTLSGVDTTMKYKLSTSDTWTSISGSTVSLTNLTDGMSISVVAAGSSSHATLDSDPQTISITQAAVPSGIVGIGCTTAANHDGILKNVAADMEYRLRSSEQWISGTGSDITGLASGTYDIRKKASGTVLASPNYSVTIGTYTMPSLAGTVSVTGILKFGQTLTADTSSVTNGSGTFSYQWKRNGTAIDGAVSSSYVLTVDDIGTTVSVTVTCSDANGSVDGTASGVIQKASQTAPAAPSMASKTSSSITLNSITTTGFGDLKYYISLSNNAPSDSAEGWQTSPQFDGLQPSTAYYFFARYMGSNTHEAATSTASAAITTDAAPVSSFTLSKTGTHNFGSATVGYRDRTPLTVTVTNTGTQSTGTLHITLSGHATRFTLSDSTISSLAPGQSAAFTVVPKNGLPSSSSAYIANITVRDDDSGITEQFSVKFKVNAKRHSKSHSSSSQSDTTATPAVTPEPIGTTVTPPVTPAPVKPAGTTAAPKPAETMVPEETDDSILDIKYEITDGADSSWNAEDGQPLTFCASGDLANFVGIRVDGELVDNANYTSKKGSEENSILVTLHEDYLETLSSEKHTIELVWEGGTAETDFTISSSDSVPTDTVPVSDSEQKDSSPVWVVILAAVLAILLAAAALLIKNKDRLSKRS